MTRLTAGTAAVLAVMLVAVSAEAQTTRFVPVPVNPGPVIPPGQNISPPAPRQNLAAPPMRTPRPGEGDSTTRIQNDWNSRMPAPPPPGR